MPGKKNKKATSKSQRRLMGWALACKQGKTDNCPSNVKKVIKSFDQFEGDLESMAKTKEKKLPEKKTKD